MMPMQSDIEEQLAIYGDLLKQTTEWLNSCEGDRTSYYALVRDDLVSLERLLEQASGHSEAIADLIARYGELLPSAHVG